MSLPYPCPNVYWNAHCSVEFSSSLDVVGTSGSDTGQEVTLVLLELPIQLVGGQNRTTLPSPAGAEAEVQKALYPRVPAHSQSSQLAGGFGVGHF
jgi:hypothetical protein